MPASVEIKGVDELEAGIHDLAGGIAKKVPKAFEKVAAQAAPKVEVPRRTGRLAGSVKAAPAPAGASLSMGAGVPYARFVEYGGRGFPHSAQGNYLYPAAHDAEPELVQAGERVAHDEIGAVNWPS